LVLAVMRMRKLQSLLASVALIDEEGKPHSALKLANDTALLVSRMSQSLGLSATARARFTKSEQTGVQPPSEQESRWAALLS
jgi:hypothetical protein